MVYFYVILITTQKPLKMTTLVNTFGPVATYFIGFIIPVAIFAAIVISNRKANQEAKN